ncbi:hypothetical protein V6N13_011034 [Hibiscus sabdariffa]|uniref:Bifunctional inhibitor/plant lipid transfer protein/seed storage helical domain-containing protein n=1 Tax=Hibiscus sabdariffa TaxID=183260 RepID=A0ABR2SB53_9ROSI
MKSLFFSMLCMLSFLFVLANVGEAAAPCSSVDVNAAACVGFATGKDAKPSAACCSGIQQLAVADARRPAPSHSEFRTGSCPGFLKPATSK